MDLINTVLLMFYNVVILNSSNLWFSIRLFFPLRWNEFREYQKNRFFIFYARFRFFNSDCWICKTYKVNNFIDLLERQLMSTRIKSNPSRMSCSIRYSSVFFISSKFTRTKCVFLCMCVCVQICHNTEILNPKLKFDSIVCFVFFKNIPVSCTILHLTSNHHDNNKFVN